MFENLIQPAPDKIIEMITLFRADDRDNKMDLGVGVYKNAKGQTPIMRAVKTAEGRLYEKQTSKSYVALQGQQSFIEAMRELSLGDSLDAARVAGIQTPGGTGAIRQIYELVRRADPSAAVWVSTPSWPNHVAILKYLGMPHNDYVYFDPESCEVDFEGMISSLSHVNAGDVVILHGCCHNPTGANLNAEQWEKVAELLVERGAIPMIDLAYQGFGDGLEEDALGTRIIAKHAPEFFIAQSCSKNFGLYRDRVGVAFAVVRDAEQMPVVQANLNALNRLNYSFPPDHGAALVAELWSDPKLVKNWKDELEAMRLEMLQKRVALAEALRRETNSDRFDFVEHHRGMFSLIGITPEQVMKLREEDAIYVVHDSRINIAGLQMARVDDFAAAVARVIR